MEKYYTTGEVAKECQMTKRAIQYYDRNDIVCPSQISEGGRRLYSQEDIHKLKCLQLYKSLGFSLEEIRQILIDYSSEQLLNYITQQEINLKKEVVTLKEKEKHLKLIKEEMKEQPYMTISNLDDLNKVKKHRKTGKITLLLLICFEIFLVVMFPLFASKGPIYISVILISTILFLIYLIYYHSSNNAYICPQCHYKFEINFLKDAFTLNNGKKGKVLRCPHCKTYTTMKEVYKDK